MIIPRQQVIPFTVLSGQTLDMTAYTKYDHSKVVGVVLLPDKNIFGDRIFLEINKEIVLPYGFNAGLISFRQFLNKEMKRNVYSFEEWALGSEVRIIYKNNDKRNVKIDMILLTVQGDHQPIAKRKKLQIVPVPYTKNPIVDGFEPCEIRTKTDFYYDELIGVFNDHFNYFQTAFDQWLSSGEIGQIIRDFLDLYEMPPANSADEKTDKVNTTKALLERIKTIGAIPNENQPLINAMTRCLFDYLSGTPEPEIERSKLFALQESIDSYILYDDGYMPNSNIELIVGATPFYPKGFPIDAIIPRYRKSFNETMYRCEMKVQHADIFISYVYEKMKSNRPHLPLDFSMYFLYNQTVK